MWRQLQTLHCFNSLSDRGKAVFDPGIPEGWRPVYPFIQGGEFESHFSFNSACSLLSVTFVLNIGKGI